MCVKVNHEHSCQNPFENFDGLISLGNWMIKVPENKFRKIRDRKMTENMQLGTVLRMRCLDTKVLKILKNFF